jgi:ATP-binding cassette subfamily F protein 3
MVQLSAVRKAFGARVLIDAVNWRVQPGDRFGLCGPNGAGKTTLLRMMAGLDEPDAGVITRPNGLTVGYLPQDGLIHTGRTLFAEASEAFDDLLAIQREMRDIESRLGDTEIPTTKHDQMLERYSDVQEAFRDRGGYDIESKVTTVLRGLGFQREQFSHRCETFSGGWQMRIALAKLLLRGPRLLLLDEPTNHLDLEARNWLEDYLMSYSHALVLVSHDRFFLDAVATSIVEIGLRKLTSYKGGYSAYVIEREARLERLREQKRRQDEEVARMQAFVDRFRYQATKAAQVQSRVKLLDKIIPLEIPPERKRVHFHFPGCTRSARVVIELKDVRKAYGDLTVFERANVLIERGDRVALVGSNGTGKSTLMRILSGEEAPDAGERVEGHNLVAQYFAQDEATRLDDALTVHDTLAEGSPVQMVPAIRNILGGFLFSGDDIYKRVAVLSGGERTRLAVARMLLRPSNTLLLDEPTNHLDIDSTNVLLDALVDYGGTLVFVSHDRYFVDRLATKVLEIGSGDAGLYPGTYEEFRLSKLERTQRPTATVRTSRTVSKPATSTENHRQNQAEVRRKERRRKALEARISDLEQRISDREATVQQLEAKMASPDFYSDAPTAQNTINRHQTLMWEVGDLMNQWEALQNQVNEHTEA